MYGIAVDVGEIVGVGVGGSGFVIFIAKGTRQHHITKANMVKPITSVS